LATEDTESTENKFEILDIKFETNPNIQNSNGPK
jgi:hypothetical protein